MPASMFMSSDRGDMGQEAKLVPGTGVCGNRAFMKAHPDVTRRFTQALRDASATYAAAPKAEMVAIMAEWSRQDPAVIEAMYERFDPRVGLTAGGAHRPGGTSWGRRCWRAARFRRRLTVNDVFDLDYVRQNS